MLFYLTGFPIRTMLLLMIMQSIPVHEVPESVVVALAGAPEQIQATGTTLATLSSSLHYHWQAVEGWVCQWESQGRETTARRYFRCIWER